MRFFTRSSTLAVLLTSAHLSHALVAPLQRLTDAILHLDSSSSKVDSTPAEVSQEVLSDDFDASLLNSTFIDRRQACAGTLCGYYKQLCCVPGTACITDAANQAQCMAVAGLRTLAATQVGGVYATYTATYVQTDLVTYTTTYYALVTGSTQCAAGTTYCAASGGCCAANQYCYASGCGPLNAFTTEGGVTAGAPARPTSVTGVIITATISPSTTIPFVPAESATMSSSATSSATPVAMGSSGGLSGGAIAGIVIGVLAALILLGLICFCCCLKAGVDGILALLGLGGKKDKKKTYVEEEVIIDRHRRHGSASQSAAGRTWYGGSEYSRPSRPPPSRKNDNKKKKEAAGLLAGLGGLAAIFGIKKKLDERKDEKSDVASSYGYSDYSYSYSYDSESERTRSDYRSPPRRDSRSRRSESRR